MGCGCNKGKLPQAVATTNRSTIYQVINPVDQSIAGEFSTLPEARAKAVSISGRVKVTSKTV